MSPATLKRDLECLRSRLGAPIECDRDLNGCRNTWYLDACCHRGNALRRFAPDAEAQALDEAAQDLTLAEVQARMDAGCGINAGGRRSWVLLEFDAHAAQWASREEWHPEQQGTFLSDGRWRLRLPHSTTPNW